MKMEINTKLTKRKTQILYKKKSREKCKTKHEEYQRIKI